MFFLLRLDQTFCTSLTPGLNLIFLRERRGGGGKERGREEDRGVYAEKGTWSVAPFSEFGGMYALSVY